MKIIVIGGGPAGMMAAIEASQNKENKVIVIEKMQSLGRKLLITGKGRCNITSSLPIEDFIKNTPGNGRFLYSCYQQFTNEDIIKFLNKEGLQVKEERGNRIFPVTDHSQDVLKCFTKKLKENNVEVLYNTRVKEILVNENYEEQAKKINEENVKKSKKQSKKYEVIGIKTENETLKEYLNLTEKYGEYKTIPGYVINKDISNYSKTIVINIGSDDGVKENMTVIGNEGLVGHVISVTSSTAKVQTIIDTASSISCSMSTTKDSIVCKGTLDEESALKAMYLPTDANIIQGDSVETSGLGGIYPKGIHVGTIKKVSNSKNMTDRYALVETAVDFNKLNTVLVVKNN